MTGGGVVILWKIRMLLTSIDKQPPTKMHLLLLTSWVLACPSKGLEHQPARQSMQYYSGGGGDSGRTLACVPVEAADYTKEAANLFGNLRVPAALVAAMAVPLGFNNAPKPATSDTPVRLFLKRLNACLIMAVLNSELIVTCWSTVEVNKLQEIQRTPTRSLFELLARDCELAWIGCNVHFVIGLFLLPICTAINMWLTWGQGIGRIAALSSLSFALFIDSVFHDAVSVGDGNRRFGDSITALGVRYTSLLVRHAAVGPHVRLIAALVTGAAALATSLAQFFGA